jgi:hypothetical protein
MYNKLSLLKQAERAQKKSTCFMLKSWIVYVNLFFQKKSSHRRRLHINEYGRHQIPK